jgi:hypothetical protein
MGFVETPRFQQQRAGGIQGIQARFNKFHLTPFIHQSSCRARAGL